MDGVIALDNREFRILAQRDNVTVVDQKRISDVHQRDNLHRLLNLHIVRDIDKSTVVEEGFVEGHQTVFFLQIGVR